MPKTALNCSYYTAALILGIIIGLFLLIGCAAIYRTLGLTDQQVQDQTTQDQAAIQLAIEQARTHLWQIISAATAGAGTILSGLLARWLGTERKITTVMIKGIESAGNNDVKTAVHSKATSAGLEPKLNARVRALT